jgi:hypothetical protein
VRRCGWRTFIGALTLGLVALLPQQAWAKATVTIVATFTWDGSHDCASPRTGSVICISGQANVRGLGHVEYARDAVTTGEQTPDGCPKLSTLGTIWVIGGTAILKGKPANTCGAKDNPDAHYLYTISGGTGVLAGASGSGDIVADHGVDRWHGTLSGPHLPLKPAVATPAPSAPAASAAPVAASAAPTSAAASSSSVLTSVTSAAPTTAATPATSGATTPPAVAASKSSSSSIAVWMAVPAVVIVVAFAIGAVMLRRRRAGSGQGPA